ADRTGSRSARRRATVRANRLRTTISTGFVPLCRAPRFTVAEQIAEAAPAQRGVLGVRADVRAVMPAAFALQVCRGDHVDAFLGLAVNLDYVRRRRDQHELQVVAEACE